MAVMSALAVLSLLVMVAGLAGVGSVVSASPSHSHVFLTPEAAAAHNHADDLADESVVNLNDTSASSSGSHIHILTDESLNESVELTASLQLPVSHQPYADPLFLPPEQPPRTS